MAVMKKIRYFVIIYIFNDAFFGIVGYIASNEKLVGYE
jgi:hypothetical protein